jgi:demethylmenaquinone methyltransferase/2-methoxy-6-polyprenyl-1,4-benzoquinol methylase
MENQLPHDTIVPFKNSTLSKKQQVASMFDNIAFRYDFMNRFLSGGIDVHWRKRAIRELNELNPKKVLDVATGTGDVAILTYKLLKPDKIIGIDLSEGMLELGRQKVNRLKLRDHIELLQGDSETINFPDNSFDAITVAFGVRNYEHLNKGLQEMYRVLRPGGKLVILEFSKPGKALRGLYKIYMNNIAPVIGKIVSRNGEAYQYLNDSVQAFPEGEHFLNILNETGLKNSYLRSLSFGICTIYCGYK